MKDRAPAFQFYPRQFTGDDRVMAMDLDAIGAHILLMCCAAASPEGCRIDADEYAIRMRVRNPSEDVWQRIKKQLLAGAWKVSQDGKWWVQDGLQRTFQKQKKFSGEQRQRANKLWAKKNAGLMPESSRIDAQPDAESMPKVCSSSSSSSSSSNLKTNAEGRTFNSTEVAQVLCQNNAWSGRPMIWALQAAIEFQAKRTPEVELEQIGEALVAAYARHKSEKGKFAVGPQKFFEQGLYCPTCDRREAKADLLTDNPATRALAQMEAS